MAKVVLIQVQVESALVISGEFKQPQVLVFLNVPRWSVLVFGDVSRLEIVVYPRLLKPIFLAWDSLVDAFLYWGLLEVLLLGLLHGAVGHAESEVVLDYFGTKFKLLFGWIFFKKGVIVIQCLHKVYRLFLGQCFLLLSRLVGAQLHLNVYLHVNLDAQKAWPGHNLRKELVLSKMGSRPHHLVINLFYHPFRESCLTTTCRRYFFEQTFCKFMFLVKSRSHYVRDHFLKLKEIILRSRFKPRFNRINNLFDYLIVLFLDKSLKLGKREDVYWRVFECWEEPIV